MANKNEVDMGKLNDALRSAASSGVRNLTYHLEGNVVKIVGEADTLVQKQNAFKSITAIMGDTGLQNAIEIKAAAAAHPAGAAATTPSPVVSLPSMTSSSGGGGRTHTVKKGETLSKIAQETYGKASAYTKIFEANKDQLKDPDKIQVGMVLRLPD